MSPNGEAEQRKERKPRRQSIGSRYIGMRGRIFAYFLLFTFIILVVLWVAQIWLLDAFYERIRTDQMRQSGAALVTALEEDEEGLDTAVYRLAREMQFCISVYAVPYPELFSVSSSEVSRADLLADCIIHVVDSSQLGKFYRLAVANNGAYSQRYQRTLNEARPVEGTLWQRITQRQEWGLPDSLVHVRVITTAEGRTYMVLINASISPLTATTNTLRVQLLMVSCLLLIMSLIISTAIARHLSRPIFEMNKAARKLAEGDFSGNFTGHGYREVSELADTLNFAASELAKSGRLQQDIIANISHDLRTPLTMIGGYAEFMRDFPDEDHGDSIQVIIDETDRLSRLVSDVLDYSRLNSGVQELRPVDFDLAESLRELAARYNALTEKDGFHVELRCPEEAIVRGDEQRIMQAVGNLLNNALAHCGEDKLVRLLLTRRNDHLRLEVSDHGPGIAPADLPYIWQRYYHTDAPQRTTHGSGLGLSIVKGVLDQHQAVYGVESVLGQGSTFWFELPFRS